ncbi:ChbG/HpnK family deacetylase [Streptococcus parasuis]|uniref:ChbG/HpnK family deacetylase n=1 Tax=Streptococcus parasuis TaxID=1501662 RepID=UPI0025A5D9A6|nr:ChbG/HpnK family deacetylase [Streptococcus parasuis]WJQ85080.1 ChbG/HpnK family deacetylase [Streptococcus parasuis]HEM3672538.1 ChbG/HpnK family deacetylase [Streptococcus suis]
MKKILIRADDLGYSRGVNYGIYDSVDSGLVKSVGFMVNMDATMHGYNLIKDKDISLGLHVNICVGYPISDFESISSLCDSDGQFKTSKEYRDSASIGVDFVELEHAVKEIEAQYHRFCSIVGRDPDYFEGHAVASPNFFKALEIVAERYELSYFPMSFEDDGVFFGNSKVYPYIPKDLQKYSENPFLAVQDCLNNLHEDGCDLMVFHPGYVDAYLEEKSSMTLVRAKEAEMLCNPSVLKWLDSQRVIQTDYNSLK